MNTEQRVVEILKKDAEALTSTWALRLSASRPIPSHFSEHSHHMIRVLVAHLDQLLEGQTSLSSMALSVEAIRQKDEKGLWAMDLRHSLDLFLIGETVVRDWVFRQWSGDASEKCEVFVLLNQAFQKLLKAHARDYCQRCRAVLTPPPGAVEKENRI